MLLKRRDYLLLAEENNQPGGGGAQPATSSADESEAPDPVVDEFIAAGTKPEEKPGEGPAAPAAKPGEQPPAPAAPAVSKPAEQPAVPPAESKPPAAQPPAAPAAAPAPTPTPTPAPAATPQPPVAQPPAPQPVAAPVPQPPATPEPPKGPTPEEQEKQRKEQRTAYVEGLLKQYDIPKEQHEALLTSPETVLPRMFAEVHTRAAESAIATVLSNIEPIVVSILDKQRSRGETEKAFYGKWPKLDNEAGRRVVDRLMTSYITINRERGLTPDQILNDVGLMAMTELRIPLDIPGSPPPAVPASPAFAPPAPPAAPGGGGMPQPSRRPGAWDAVDQELFGDEPR